MRARVYSRFRNATKYQIFISYTTEEEERIDNRTDLINGYYCTCQSGARTLGACAHVTSILWFLGFARHQENVKYPDKSLLNNFIDTANRDLQRNNQEDDHGDE